MNLEEKIAEKQDELGIFQFAFTTTDKLSINQGVRDLCEMNTCGQYGKSWCCPPGVGTVEDCRDRIMQFKNVFVYTSKHDLEDSFDFEGMMEGKDVHEAISRKVVDYFNTLVPDDKLILSGDGCARCAKCTYPDAPCRFPNEVFPTVESYGVEVYSLANKVHINYINGKNTVTYFGCIMF